ncbi:MAG: GH3 auxin-responsive promoter family protein [Rikenellaceae bacterium]
MASIINKTLLALFSSRLKEIDRHYADPLSIQLSQFDLLCKDSNQYIKSFGDISTIEKFQNNVPVVDYEGLSEHIEKVRSGQKDALWASSPSKWAAKSSGTTASVSKYIPITKQYLDKCHYQGSRDTLALSLRNFPDTLAVSGKSLTLGGSAKIEQEGRLLTGDLSAILIENTPWYALTKRLPKSEVALIPNFEEKVAAICRATATENITSFAGVPSWNLVLMNSILDYTGKNNIHEVWRDMSLFAHGGIAFEPYRAEYQRLFPDPKMRYIETYNASEGFFGIQDDPSDSAMLLMLDYQIFYEFIPTATLYDHSTVVTLEGVKTGVNYAMVISTSCGLWRYMIGDTVQFTSTAPYKIKITGRTKSFINAFGEEVIVDNADKAIRAACDATGTEVLEYTAAPIFMEGKEKGAHQWVIECIKEPSCKEEFVRVLDQTLQQINSDYGAKRFNSTTLNAPKVHFVASGTFKKWMEGRGKLGGQNKVPRLSNSREHVESLLSSI